MDISNLKNIYIYMYIKYCPEQKIKVFGRRLVMLMFGELSIKNLKKQICKRN